MASENRRDESAICQLAWSFWRDYPRFRHRNRHEPRREPGPAQVAELGFGLVQIETTARLPEQPVRMNVSFVELPAMGLRKLVTNDVACFGPGPSHELHRAFDVCQNLDRARSVIFVSLDGFTQGRIRYCHCRGLFEIDLMGRMRRSAFN